MKYLGPKNNISNNNNTMLLGVCSQLGSRYLRQVLSLELSMREFVVTVCVIICHWCEYCDCGWQVLWSESFPPSLQPTPLSQVQVTHSTITDLL